MRSLPNLTGLETAWYRFERWAYARTGWRWLPGITLRIMDRRRPR